MVKKRVVIWVAGPKKTPIGERHPRAVLSDEEVELIREIHEEGFLKMTAIAKAFGVSKSYVWNVVNYYRRNTTPEEDKTIEITISDAGELTKFEEIND